MDSKNNSMDDNASNADNNYFIYADADKYETEIAELYSYTESSEFHQNFRAFVIEVEKLKVSTKWSNIKSDVQSSFVLKMIDRLETSDRAIRMRASRCIFYLAQGCCMEVNTAAEQKEMCVKNVHLLYSSGIFPVFVDLLNIELEKAAKSEMPAIECEELHLTMIESTVLRLILNVLYIIVETIRSEGESGNPNFHEIALDLATELSNPMSNGELLHITLLEMVTAYNKGISPHFPIKKVVLLLWKSTLISLGGTKIIREHKNELRIKAGLVPFLNDTLEVAKHMRATILTAVEDLHVTKKIVDRGKRIKATIFDANDETASTSLKRSLTNAIPKHNKTMQRDTRTGENSAFGGEVSATVLPSFNLKNSFRNSKFGVPTKSPGNCGNQSGALLFSPKVRSQDIEIFLQNARQKYFGYSLPNDHETVIGLPAPIQESVRTLHRHLYVSLGEVQISMEKQQMRRVFKEVEEIEPTIVENLYEAMLPKFYQYMSDLMQILLAASPTAKLTTGEINSRIITDMLPKNPSQAIMFSNAMKIDVMRHKEIIVKAVSAFLMLCLKHFKLNHIYQCEYMCELLAQVNCLKIILQDFAPSLGKYVNLMTSVPTRDFPACVIIHENECSSKPVDFAQDARRTYSWRNMFAAINLLRLVNKIVKWKHSRVLNMVSLESVIPLKDLLKVQQPLLQVYVLKLIKMQAKYMGRNWRRTNLKILTAIYTKVRPRFNDGWAYSYNTVGDFWAAQETEMELKLSVRNFHARRYPLVSTECLSTISPPNSARLYALKIECGFENSRRKIELIGINSTALRFNDAERNATSIKDREHKFNRYALILPMMESAKAFQQFNENDEDLPKDFKDNYENWLEAEVYTKNFDWDTI